MKENDLCMIFPRGQNPDTRPDKQFITMLLNKGVIKPSPGYRHTNSKPIKCLTDGREFQSIGAAERHYGIREGAIKQYFFHNRRKTKSLNGLTFELI